MDDGAQLGRARTAVVAAWLAAAGVAAMAAGAAGAQTGALGAFIGFRVFLLGALVCLLALLVGLLALRATRRARGRPGRSHAWLGTALGLLGLGVVVSAAWPGRGLPAINDITTDPADPPAFAALTTVEANRGRDMAYAGDSFAEQQRAAYPDLAPIALPLAPAEALARAEAAARALGWQIAAVDPAAGTLEASETTPLFRFVDDVAVRVRPSQGGSGSIVDVRSRSRDGRGDLGANAARIRAFRDALLSR
jgi:uncharacterized protein (DUF1499 family)